MSGIQELLQENAETTTTKVEVASNSVCTSLMPPPPRRTPWLVFFAHGGRQKLQTFVNLSEKTVLVRDVEEMRRVVYYAQLGSWLFMTDFCYSGCFLLNLSSRKKITLPPLPRGSRYITDAVITRSSPPPPLQAKGIIRSSRVRTLPPPVILTYREDRDVFLFHRVGDVGWEVAKCRVEGGISSLVRCNGKIYAIDGRWLDLVVVDVDVVSCPRVITTVLSVERVAIPRGTTCHKQLLESCGELFLVFMHFVFFTRRFHSFAVYRLDSSGDGTMRWVEVDDLGEDRAFFFGTMWCEHQGPGMSCSASAAGIAANCIYFVDHNHRAILKFDMADKSVSTVMSWPMVSRPWANVAWLKYIHL